MKDIQDMQEYIKSRPPEAGYIEQVKIDTSLENAYIDWTGYLNRYLDNQTRIGHHLFEKLNLTNALSGSSIEATDVSEVQVETNSRGIQWVSGTLGRVQHARPIFILPPEKVINICNQLGIPTNAEGFTINFGFHEVGGLVNKQPPYTSHRLDLIVTASDASESYILGELLKSIDPNMRSRELLDRFTIGTLATFFHERYASGANVRIRTLTDGTQEPYIYAPIPETSLEELKSRLIREYHSNGIGVVQEDDFLGNTDRLFTIIVKLEAFGLEGPQIHRALLNSRSLSELKRLVEIFEDKAGAPQPQWPTQ